MIKEVRSSVLVPDQLASSYADGNLEIQRATIAPGPGTVGIPALAAALKKLAVPEARVRMKFKIIKVTPDDSLVTTRQIVEYAAFANDRINEQHATWKITWLPAAGDAPPLIRAIELESFEQSQRGSAQTLFTDCTASAIGALDCYAPQLARGANHWLGRSQDSEANSQMGVPGIAVGDGFMSAGDDGDL